MGVIGIGVGTAKMGRICRDKDGNITEQSTARWDVDPDGGSVAIWPMDPEKMEPSGPAEVYGDWDAATGVILLSVQRGIQTAAGKSGHMNMEEIGLDRSGK